MKAPTFGIFSDGDAENCNRPYFITNKANKFEFDIVIARLTRNRKL